MSRSFKEFQNLIFVKEGEEIGFRLFYKSLTSISLKIFKVRKQT